MTRRQHGHSIGAKHSDRAFAQSEPALPNASPLQRFVNWPGVPYLAAFGFYLLTLAPTVLWGDDAEFQRRAYTLGLGAGITDHPLYLLWAHLFTRLPVGDAAFRVNLCSAVGAAIGVGVVHALIRRLKASTRAAWIGAGSLAVCQAYWMHGVRAEVYSTYLALFALFLLAGVLWLDTRESKWLALATFMLSLSFSVHMLALTALPGLIILSMRARSLRDTVAGLGGLIAGLIPLGLFIWLTGEGELARQLADTARELPSPARWPKDAALFAGFLLYQFPLALLLAGPGLRRLWTDQRWAFAFLGLAWLGNTAFLFDLQVPDRYVFFLPSYIIVAIWIGVGSDWLIQRRRIGPLLEVATLLAPIALYVTLPLTLNALELNPFGFRNLPHRNGNLFHLLPAKTGYTGPRQFGEEVLGSLPANATVLADHTIRQNLLYLQTVEGLRPDVEIVEVYSGQGEQLPFIQTTIEEGPVFVGAVDRYLDREDIESQYTIEPYGLIYQVLPAGGNDANRD